MRRGPVVLVTAALAMLIGLPSAAAEPRKGGGAADPVAAAPAAPAPERPTEATALAAASATGTRVAVTGLRTETEDVYANPNGTFTMIQHVLPVRVRQGASWVPVDATLRVGRDGAIRPAATTVPITLSGGGTTPLARVSWHGNDFALGWPGALPVPELSGDTATYRDVLPDVDLVVTADVLGFSEVLVVRTPEAARQPALRTVRLTTRGTGLTRRVDQAGNIDVVDAAGAAVFHAGTPMMWDSSGGADAHGFGSGEGVTRHGIMPTTAAADGVGITPDAAMLADPATRFPVYIDPSVHFSGARLAWTSVWKAYPTSTYYNSSDIARVGHENDTGMTNRSFFRMNTSTGRGKHLIAATFKTYENHSWSCSARQVEVWRTGAISSATSWNTQPAWSAQLQVLNVAKGYSSSCPDGTVSFTVTAGVVTAAASNWSDLTLGLRATSETDTYAWKKFANNPTLEVDYNSVPSVPTSLSIDPGLPCVTGTGRPSVPTATPTIRAKLSDVDSGQLVGGRFEWWVTGGSKIAEATTTKVASGSSHAVTIPVNAFVDGGTYSWRVRAEDGTDVSAWSGFCELTVDLTAPGSVPVITSTTYPETPSGAEPVYRGSVGIAGSFTFSPGPGDTDVAAYLYSLNQFPPTTVVAGSGSPPSATVSLTPTTDGLNTLYVRGRDGAGNLGPVYGYQFYVRPVTMPVGLWRLDEAAGSVAADTSGSGLNATATGGVSWTAGRIGGAARFNGTDGVLGTAAPALRTDTSFTASAWVRLDGTGGNFTAVSQDGTRQSGFQLGYASDLDRWTFGMVTVDTDTEVLHRAVSTAPPVLHVWTHLLGSYDKSTGQLSLYVDGTLQGTAAHSGAWQAGGGVAIGRGRWRGSLVNWWPGDLDDVQLFQGILPPDTIMALARPAPVLVGQWRLDETSGTVAADSSGAGRSATVSAGCTWAPGWFDGSLSAAGACNAATVSPVVRTDQSFTVAAWLRFTGAVGSTLYTAVSQEGAVNSGFLLQYMTFDNVWGFTMPTTDTTGETYVTARSPQPVALDVWTHVAGVYDAPTGQMRLYIDGTLVSIVAHPNAWHAAGSLEIGRAKWHGLVGDWWLGGIDDVRVFQGALSDDEIYQLTVQ